MIPSLSPISFDNHRLIQLLKNDIGRRFLLQPFLLRMAFSAITDGLILVCEGRIGVAIAKLQLHSSVHERHHCQPMDWDSGGCREGGPSRSGR
jgi:hypothetical protein